MKKILLVSFFLSLSTLAFARSFYGSPSMDREPPAPQLLEPGDTVNVERGADVCFRWMPASFGGGEFQYEFRLYHGKEMVEKNLLFSKKISQRENSILIKSDRFEENKLYAFSVRLVGPSKSRASYSLFKVHFKK